MTRLFARTDHDEPPALHTGFLLTLTSAVGIVLASFANLSHLLVVLTLALATVGVVAGLVLHVAVRAAHQRRNARHRAWVETVGSTGLADFRAEVAHRQDAVDQLDRSWGLPLGASFALLVSSFWVPWEMIAPLAPSPSVDELTAWWLVVSLGSAGLCVALSVVAAVRSDGHLLPERQHEDV